MKPEFKNKYIIKKKTSIKLIFFHNAVISGRNK